MALTAQVKWVGENGDTSHRPTSLNLQILRNSTQYQSDTITEAENWYKRWGNISPSRQYQYTVRVTTVTDFYTFTYEDSHTSSGWNQYNDSTVITATYVPPPEPEYKNVSVEVVFYNDNQNEWEMRPVYVDVTLKRNGAPVQTIRLGNGWNWNWVWENLSYEDEWTVIAEEIPEYVQEVTQTDNSWRFAYRFGYVPPTPPDPSPGNHPTKEDLDLMYSVLYDDISAENAQDVIHVLNYGTHIEGDG